MAALRPQALLGDNESELTLRAIDLYDKKMKQHNYSDEMVTYANKHLIEQIKEHQDLRTNF